MVTAELEELLVADAVGWRAWPVDNHQRSPGMWLVLTKKGGRVTPLTYPAALDEAPPRTRNVMPLRRLIDRYPSRR